MNNKVIDFINKVIEPCNIFIGYENDDIILNVYNSIFQMLLNAYDLSSMEIEFSKGLIDKVISINKYSDYLLISRCSDFEVNDLLICDQYFKVLEEKQNKVARLNVEAHKQLVNSSAYKGIVRGVFIKAYLSYFGMICESNKELAIKLFKEIAYSYDPFYFKLLAYIDSANKQKYIDIYNCYNDKLENLIIGKNEKYSDLINDECELIFICQELLIKNERLDHEMFEYLFNSDSSLIEKKKAISMKQFTNKENKRQRMGF